MSKRHDQLIAYIMAHRSCDEPSAEAWSNEHLGNDWRTRKPQKTKRTVLKNSEEKEHDNE